MRSTLDEVVDALDAKRAGDGYLARCPAHDDSSPSLSFTESGGKLLVNCHAGCSFADIIKALAERNISLRNDSYDEWAPEQAWTIRNAEGLPLAQHVRVDKPDGKIVYWRGPYGEKTTPTELGIKTRDLPLYGSELLEGRPGEMVVITEGEKAADAARKLGLLALGTVTGARSCPSDEVLRLLAGRDVVVSPDQDGPGRAHAKMLAAALRRVGAASVRTLPEWPGMKPGHDLADYRGTADELLALLGSGDHDSSTFKAGEPVLIAAVDVITHAPEPLWASRLYFGKVTLLEGAPGKSKTTLACDVIARASRGGPMPDSPDLIEPISSIILSAEDDPADTLVPRLKLAGADLSRVNFLAGKFGVDGETDDDISVPDDIDTLRDAIRRTGARLILIDPLFGYVRTGTDTNGDHKVRRALGPLHRLAGELNVCVIAVRHHRKAAGADPINAGGGSVGIIAAARLALLVAEDPDSEGSFLLAGVKSNIGPPAPTLKYRLVTGELEEHPGVTWTRIEWQGVSERSAGDILSAEAEQGAVGHGLRAEIEAWLRDKLSGGPVLAKELKREAVEMGYAWRTVHRVKDAAGVKPRRHGGQYGGDPRSWWELGDSPLKMTVSTEDDSSDKRHLQGEVSSSAKAVPVGLPAGEAEVAAIRPEVQPDEGAQQLELEGSL